MARQAHKAALMASFAGVLVIVGFPWLVKQCIMNQKAGHCGNAEKRDCNDVELNVDFSHS